MHANLRYNLDPFAKPYLFLTDISMNTNITVCSRDAQLPNQCVSRRGCAIGFNNRNPSLIPRQERH